MNLPRTFLRLVPIIAALASLHARGADVKKAANTGDLNIGASWTGGIAPTAGDIALWDSIVTAGIAAQMGGDLSWLGIRETNVGGPRDTAGTFISIDDTGSQDTLTLGAGGIDLSTATQALRIQGRVILGANQTWDVSNANANTTPGGLSVGEDLFFIAQNASATMNLGGFTVQKNGADVAAISSGYAVSNGVFDVNAGTLHFQGAAGRATTIANSAAFRVHSGGTLAFAAQSAGTVVNAPISLATGATLQLIPAQSTSVALNGNITITGDATVSVIPQLNGSQNAAATLILNGNLASSGNLTFTNTLTVLGGNALRLTGDNSAFTGTITLAGTTGARTLRLQGAASGSTAATWWVNAGSILQVDGVGVQLGVLNGAGSVVNSDPAHTATLNIRAGHFSGMIGNGIAPLVLTKTSPGTLILDGPQNYGTLNATAGTTQLDATLGTGASSLNVGGIANISADQHLDELNISVGGIVNIGSLAPAFSDSLPAIPEPQIGALMLTAFSLVLRRPRRR